MNCAEIELNLSNVISRRVSSEEILTSVCEVSGFDIYSLKSPKRTRDLTEYRFISYALLRLHTRLSLKKIGEMFSRDHSTIIYGLDTHNDLFETEPIYKSRFEQVINHLFGREWKRIERERKVKLPVKARVIKNITLPLPKTIMLKKQRAKVMEVVSIPRSTYSFNKYAL